jgi:hypothetical protein
MSQKRKTAAVRLRREIERALITRQLHELVRQPKPDFHDKQVRAAYANVALTIDAEPAHSPIRKAFQKFGLDPLDPLDWRLLLSGLAASFFDRTAPRPRGARPKWDEPRRMTFQTDVAMARTRLKASAKRLGLPPPTDDDVAAYLHDILPSQYGSMSAASLRKYIASGPPKGRR